jgi:energy-coupling factor transporter ATP-binding protein EcfA2
MGVAAVVIQRIELVNFRSFELAAFDLDQPRTLVLGPNGAGKSTMVDAIAWALTGRCRGVDGAGRGQKDLIRSGAASMSVALDVQGLGRVERSLALGGHAVSNVPTDVILNQLGVSEGMLLAVLYGGTFFSMGHADGKALLLQLLDVRVAPDLLPGMGYTEPATLAQIDRDYAAAVERRAALKKAVAAAYVPPAPAAQPTLVPGAVRAAANRYQMLARSKAEAAAEDQTCQRELASITTQIDAGPSLASRIAVHQGMLHEAKAKVVELQALAAEATTVEGNADGMGAQASELRLQVERLQRHDGTRGCVLAAGIPCLTGAEHFAGEVKALKKKALALERKVSDLKSQREAQAEQQAQLQAAERTVSYHEGQLEQLEAKLALIDGLAAKAQELRDRLAAAQKTLGEMDGELQQARDSMEAEQNAAVAMATYEAEHAAHTEAAARAGKLKAELVQAEAQVSLLGPKGVRATALQEKLGGFEQLINDALQPFGFAVRFSLDPWRVEVERGGHAVAFDLLSAGEQVWTALGFQLALALVSGLNVAVVDAAEAVVGVHRQVFTSTVMAAPVAQVIVAMARGEAEASPDIPGLQVVRLTQDNGVRQ